MKAVIPVNMPLGALATREKKIHISFLQLLKVCVMQDSTDF